VKSGKAKLEKLKNNNENKDNNKNKDSCEKISSISSKKTKEEITEVAWQEVTRQTAKKTMIKLAPPCRCRACSTGCNYGGGILEDADIQKIAEFLKISVDSLKSNFIDEIEKFNTKRWRTKFNDDGKGYGKCAFFKDNQCAIHQVKPLQCRIATGCKPHGQDASIWFHLNYFVNENDPESIRQWAQYLKTHPTIPGGKLEELVPDKDRLDKILSYEILK